MSVFEHGKPAVPGYLRAGDINFDREHYQRDPVESVIGYIAANWRLSSIGRIPVSRREDGTFWAYDGQQRTLATIRRFNADFMMPVDVSDGMTIKDEAREFHGLNVKRRLVGPVKEFSSGLLGEEPECVAIAGVLAEFGITPVFTAATKDREIICYASLHSIVKRGGIDHLRKTLWIINEAWDCQEETMQALFIKGVSLLIRSHEKDPVWDCAEVVRRFKTVSPSFVTRRAKDFRQMSTRCSATSSIYRTLHEIYNKGRKTRRLGDVRGGDD